MNSSSSRARVRALLALTALAVLFAGPPAGASEPETLVSLDLDSLERLAGKADRLIDDCRDGTIECWGETARDALARAYLVRVTHARVVLGKVDMQAASNARYLAPLLAEGWRDALPEDDGTLPEEWLFDLELSAMAAQRAAEAEQEEDEGYVPPPPPPSDELQGFDEPDLERAVRPAFSADDVVGTIEVHALMGIREGPRFQGTTLTGGPELSPEGQLRLRLAPRRRLVVVGSVAYTYIHRNSPGEIQWLTSVTAEEQEATGRTAILARHRLAGSLGAGVRIGDLSRHLVQVFGAADVAAGGFTTKTNVDLWSDYEGTLASPGWAGFGAHLGVEGAHSLDVDHRWALTWHLSGLAEKRWTHDRYRSPTLPFEFPRTDKLFPEGLTRDDTTDDYVGLDVEVSFRYRVARGIAISLDPTFRLGAELTSAESATAWDTPRSVVSWWLMPRVSVTGLVRRPASSW